MIISILDNGMRGALACICQCGHRKVARPGNLVVIEMKSRGTRMGASRRVAGDGFGELATDQPGNVANLENFS